MQTESPQPTEQQHSQAPPRPPKGLSPFQQFAELLDMIKFEHSVFDLPVAFLGAQAAALPGGRCGRTGCRCWN